MAIATAKIHWQAKRSETLPLLFEPAVLTHVNYPKSLKLAASIAGSRSAQQLVAQSGGAFDIEVQYQLQIIELNNDSGLVLPVPGRPHQPRHPVAGGSGRGCIFAPGRVRAAQHGGQQYGRHARALARQRRVGWKPRSRDVKN